MFDKCWARALAWTNSPGEKQTRRACEVEEIGGRRGDEMRIVFEIGEDELEGI